MLRLTRRERSKCFQLYKSLMIKNKTTFSYEKSSTSRGFLKTMRGFLKTAGGFLKPMRGFYEKTRETHTGLLCGLKTAWSTLRPRVKTTASAALALVLAFSIVIPIVLGNPTTAQAAAVATPSPTPVPAAQSVAPTPSQNPQATVPIELDAMYAGVTVNPQPSLPPAQYARLGPGDEGEAVKVLQDRLMELDYFENDETTDFYGTATEYAVQLFQRQYGLMVDGIAGLETQTLLFSEDAHPYTIYPGNNGSDIKGLQRRLTELYYFNDEITGFFGASTEAAVRSFQKLNDLKIDGIVDTDTRDLIFSPEAKESPTPLPKPTPKPTVKPTGGKVTEMIAFAKQQLGKRYVRGAEGSKTFDCSGFSYYVVKHMGIETGRYNAAGFSKMSSWAKVSSVSKLKAGDLVFFSSKKKRVSHMGIYIGDGKLIHASSSHGKVIISDMSGYFVRNFVCGRRVFS